MGPPILAAPAPGDRRARDELWGNCLAAALAGGLQISLCNPLDCLRVRLQVADPPPAATAGTLAFGRACAAHDGYWHGLHRPGLAWNVLAVAASQGGRLGLYPTVRDAGAIAIAASSGVNPMDRQQGARWPCGHNDTREKRQAVYPGPRAAATGDGGSRAGLCPSAEREFPALLVVWGYQQNQLIFGTGEFFFARKRENFLLVFFPPFGGVFVFFLGCFCVFSLQSED